MKVLFAFHEQNEVQPFFVCEREWTVPPGMHDEVTFTHTDDAIDGEVFIVVRVRWSYDGAACLGPTATVKLWRAPWAERRTVEEQEPITA